MVALAILSLFPFQPVRSPLFTRPHRVLGLVLYLAWDLFSSGVRVGWDAARFGPRTKAVIVEAPILVDRDFLVATAANMISLSPGVFVLQINRPQNCFYVYVLGVRSAAVDEHVRIPDMQMQAIRHSEQPRDPRRRGRHKVRQGEPGGGSA